MKFGMGQRAIRVEDARFLTGRGRYTDDINLPDQLYGYVLRSPYANAKIGGIDKDAAQNSPGVHAIYTGADAATAGFGTLPCLATSMVPLSRPDGSPIHVPPRAILAKYQVAFAGDYVAFVVADSLAQAKDAAELIDVDYDELPTNTDTARALEGPAVWADCPDNICFRIEMGDMAAVNAAFENAAHIVNTEIPVSRIAQNPMEPRAALGDYDRQADRYILYSGNQNPHDLRQLLCDHVFKIPSTDMRVVSPDMGGAFGMRSNTFPELALVMWAAKELGRPVKWVSDRSEAFLSDDHGRDMRLSVELALSADGMFDAIRLRNVANMGAYLSVFGPFPAFGNMGGLAGVYRTPHIAADVTGVFTNTTPIGPYRGAGRPEAILAIERAIDVAARQLDIDRVELRRRNMIAPEDMPFQTGLTYLYDCGAFERNMDAAMAQADYAGYAARRSESEARGRIRGLGVVNAIEQSAGLFDEGAELRFDAAGRATLMMGTHSHGQGHETVFRQLLADKLGLEFEQIRFQQGDTDVVSHGHGTFGSRSAVLGGSALVRASEMIVEQGTSIAAHVLEAATEDIEFEDGSFQVAGTDKAMSLADVAAAALNPAVRPPGMDAGLRAFATFTPPGPTFPNACHVCEVELDPETGKIETERYHVVCDVGNALNPLIVEGQIHGGVVQGIGQILVEEMRWDDDTGQLITGSLMDYALPRADLLPDLRVTLDGVPTGRNALGVKGAGEAGTVGGMPSLTNAVADALAQAGADMVDMPATSEKIWRALRRAAKD